MTQEPSLNHLKDETVQAYLALGDAVRIATLPDWVIVDLTISQLKALMLLGYHGSLTVSALARLLKLGNPAASILVQQLVDQALVERSEDTKDRRRTLVRLTAPGADLIMGRHRQTEIKLRELLAHLSNDQLLRVRDGLRILADLAQTVPIHEEPSPAPETDP